MATKTIRIAFYGKGGIGKSTLACNLSAAFAQSGLRVLHIGCDPKSDSTRCLTTARIPTVLDQLNSHNTPLSREDILFPGRLGVTCVEAGGPQAGVGCAGLGITAMEEELERQRILDESWDVVVYDVLGDIVCGGFSVPMRQHFVDRVYLVTSSEFMSLYAANNIMKGLVRYSTEEAPLLGGILHNHCACPEDESIAANFAQRTNTRVLGTVREERTIRRADFRREPVLLSAPESPAAAVFTRLADAILEAPVLTVPRPMDDDALEDFCRQVFDGEAQF